MSFQYEKVGVGRVSSVMVLNSVLFSNDMFAVVVVIVVCYLLWTSKLLKTLITDTHIYIYIALGSEGLGFQNHLYYILLYLKHH